MRRHLALLPVLVLAAFASGCGAGAFRQAVTSDECRAGDEKCSRSGFDAPLALGATATPETRFSLNGSASPGFHYESAAPSIVDVVDGRVVGKSEGASALLFVSDASTVLDFLHVWVKKPTTLELLATLPGRPSEGRVDGTIDLLVGEELRLTVHPLADGQRLLGSSETEWTVDPGIATILREGTEEHRRLVAEGPGTTTLRVTMLGVESSMQIVVHAAGTEKAAPKHARASKSERGAS